MPARKKCMDIYHCLVPQENLISAGSKINNLKTRAAEFLVSKFETMHSHPCRATQQPWQLQQRKDLSKWL
jgi:hypothetical protein